MKTPRPMELDTQFETVGICHMCAQRGSDFWTCKAFPDGIPNEIIVGEFPHVTPYPGDNGIMFSPKGGVA